MVADHRSLIPKLEELVRSGRALRARVDYVRWNDVLSQFLTASGTLALSVKLCELAAPRNAVDWKRFRDKQLGHLEGFICSLDSPTSPERQDKDSMDGVRRVFVVHGHDLGAKESVARFLERLGLEPVVLQELADGGDAVIEKLEKYADVCFAVVILTPDDVGGLANEPHALQGRARQNVILELGYFTARLGRERVFTLFKPGVEVPSDLHGMLFTELDANDGWRTKMIQNLDAAGIDIDSDVLLRPRTRRAGGKGSQRGSLPRA